MKQPIPNKESVVPQVTSSEPTMAGSRFSIRLFIIAFVFTGAVLAWLSWSTYALYTDDAIIKGQVWRTEELQGTIIHLDEVLTMSARMAVATGDPQWEARYRKFEPQLDNAIKEILKLAPSQTLAQTEAANLRLVEMENHAFTLVRESHPEEARTILFSQQYEEQKGIYALGTTSYFGQLQTQLEATQQSELKRAVFSAGAGIVVLAILLFSGLAIIRRMYKAQAVLLISITRRKETEEVLRKVQRELEVRVEERTADLTTANSMLVKQIAERGQIEASLRESEERYRELFENAQDAFYVHDVKGKYLSVNGAAEKLTGYSRDEIIGKNFAEFMAPEYAERIRTNIGKKVKGEGLTAYEIEVLAKDGRSVPVEVSTRLIYEKGIAVGVQGVARDITERKRAEEALRESEERYRELVENGQGLICTHDLNGTLLSVNPAAAQALGYAPSEMVGKGLIEFISPTVQPVFGHYLKLIASEPSVNGLMNLITKEGEERVWAYRNARIEGQRKTTYVLGHAQDITEQKQTEEQLRQQRDFTTTMTSSIGEGIYALDRDGMVTFMNPAAEQMLGWKQAELPDQNMHDIIHFQNADGTRVPAGECPLLEVLRSGKTLRVDDDVFTRRDGVMFPVSYTASPIVSNGQILGAVLMFHDITERQRAEEGLRESEERYRLLFESNPQPMWVYDLETLAFLAVNESAIHHYGHSRADFLAMTIKDIRPAEDLPALYDSVARSAEGVDEAGTWKHLKKDGTIIEVEITSHLLVFDGRRAELILAHDITERRRADAERLVLSEIVQGVITTSNLDELFTHAHHAISKLLAAENCFIALYDKTSDILHIPFCKDEFDPIAAPQKLGKGLTAFVLRSGRPMFMTPEFIKELVSNGEIELVGTLPAAWLGVPLRTSSDIIGVLVVQHYQDKDAYSQQDLELLASVGDQLGLAIERKQIEIKLRTNELQLNEAQHIAHLGSWELDVAANLLRWSVEHYRIFGLEPQVTSVPPETLMAYIHPDDRNRVDRALEQAYAEKVFPNIDYRIIRPNGTERTVQANGRVVVDDSGRILRIVGTLQDITERKQVDEQLRQSEEKYRTILERIEDGYFEVDLKGNYLFVNDSFGRISGRSANEMLGANFKKFFDPVLIQLLYDTYTNIYKTGEPLKGFEYEVTRGDGTKVFVEESVSLKRNATGQPIGFMGIRRDCTERKQIEAQLVVARDAALESTRLKSEFLANMSHEIRTPMNGVIGMTGLLLDTALTDEQRDYTETINASADSLMRVINDILDFSKIEAGKLRFETLDFDLLPEVESPVELLAERAHVKGIEIASLIESDVPLALRGDAGRLRQVITNLIGNAVKFTEAGEVLLRVSQVSNSATQAMLRFAVSDTGVGISEEAQRRLFRAFVQADGSTTRRYGGTGLGLAISKQLVELMGGEIGIESKVGGGSTFWFTARFEKQPAGRVRTRPTKANLEGVRVLVVDDNETNRRVVQHQIDSWGMQSTCAASGAEALLVLRSEAAAGRPYGLAILDMQMPEMDGMLLARTIKNDAAINSTRLLMLTSLGQRDDCETLRRAGIARCLGKPVKQAQLFDALAITMADETDVPRLSMPVHITKPGPEAVLSEQAARFGATTQTRILVAEDNVVNQKVALIQLQNLGYTVDVVANGREALEALTRVPYPIVLMDCQMPEVDGCEATAEIRRREEGLSSRTVIIAMTAHALEGEREKCLKAGMDDYLSKPVKSDVLRLKLEQWIKPTGEPSVCERSNEANVVVDKDKPSALDLSVLAGLREIQQPGKPDLVTELIDLFLEDTAVQLKMLRTAVSNNNAKEVRRVAHLLKGSSANMGAGPMAALYDSLEKTEFKNGESGTLLVKLDREFERVNIALRAERRPEELSNEDSNR